MSYEVWVKNILPEYYSYVKECMRKDYEDSQGTALWMIDLDRKVFEDRWFKQQGIGVITAYSHDTDKTNVVKLVFESEEHFKFWLLRWT